jgi:predicted ATP-grasp superfamily ATP-dependent carboligase
LKELLQFTDVTTPLLVLRAVAYTPLGIMRSLGRVGVSTYIAHPDRRTPAFYSRHCRKRFLYHINGGPVEEAVAQLASIAQHIGGRPILLPTTDEMAMFVADNATALEKWFLFPKQDADLVRTLCNKKEMYKAAQQLGLATPRTVFPESRAEAEKFAQKATFPVVVKGIFGLKLRKLSGKTMFIVRSQHELLEKYDRFEDAEHPNLMLQEYIGGPEDASWVFNGYFNQNSECLFASTGKKIRQCPAYGGVTSLGISERNPMLEDSAKAVLQRLGYRGIVDIDYRFDQRDGQYKVLDVNPRIGATFRLFVSASGLDVIRALYLDLTGQAVPSAAPSEGRKWLVEDLDIVSAIRYSRDRSLGLEAWVSSLRGVQECAYFAWDDPLPVLSMLFNDAKEMGRRVCKSLQSMFSQAHKQHKQEEEVFVRPYPKAPESAGRVAYPYREP